MADDEIRFYRASGPTGYLSNLYPCPVEFEGRTFRSTEDAYQFGKPRNSAVADWLVSAPSPRLCAAAGHALLVYDIRPDWDTIKVERMAAVLRAKFTQHDDLRARLLATGCATLVEDSRADAFWGIGKRGTGKNMLGVLLMELRQELRDSGGPPVYEVAEWRSAPLALFSTSHDTEVSFVQSRTV